MSSSSSSPSSSPSASMISRILLWLLLLVSSVPVLVSGSHFQFGTITWTKDPTANLFTFKFISGWRSCYSGFTDVLPRGRCAQVGDVLDVGSVFFFNSLNLPSAQTLPAGTSSGSICDYNYKDSLFNSCPHSFGQLQVALHAKVKVEQDQQAAGVGGDAWFVGTWTSDPIDITNVLGSKQTLNLPFLMMFMQCCRISTLLDNNNDINTAVGTIVTAGSLSSPVTTSRVREYAIVNQPIQYVVPGVSADKNTLAYSFSPTAGGLNSQLKNPYPSNSQSRVTMNAGSIDSVTGRFTWTPNTLWGNSQKTLPALYVVQFKIQDTKTQSVIVLDIVFQVTDGKSSPFFIDPSPPYDFTTPQRAGQFAGWKFPVGFSARTININAQDNANNKNQGANYGIASIDPTVTQLPNFAWTGVNTAITQVNAVGTGTFTYAVPSLGIPDANVCFTCRNKLGYPNVAQYCVTLVAGSDTIFASGTLRDFHRGSITVNVGTNSFDVGYNRDKVNYATATLGTDSKPVFVPNVGASFSADDYSKWWNTDPLWTARATNALPVTAMYNADQGQSLLLSRGVSTDQRIFTYRGNPFDPIGNNLFGKEGDTYNLFWTWEIHSSIDYKGGESLTFQSSDDLLVYFDSNLEVALFGTAASQSANPQSVTLLLDKTKMAKKGFGNYRVDIFMTSRSRAAPYIQLQLPDSTLCDAVSSTTGSLVQLNAGTGMPGGTAALPFTATNMLMVSPASLVDGSTIQLTNSASLNLASAVYYAQNGAISGVRVTTGFQAEFSFTMSGNPEGFAFVLQKDTLGRKIGNAGAGLGYDGLSNCLAVEFDTHQDLPNDPPYNDVSVHFVTPANNQQTNSADDGKVPQLGQFKPASAGGPNADMTLTNGTTHYVKIQFIPASSAAATQCPRAGSIRVYVGASIGPDGKPAYQVLPQVIATVNGCDMNTIWPDGAPYVGFTSSTGPDSTTSGTTTIKSFKLTIVKTDPVKTSLVSPPVNTVAGQVGSFVLQARDACGNLITTGGEPNRAVVMFLNNPAKPVTKNDYAYLESRDRPIAPSVADNGDGTYTVSYSNQYAAQFGINVTFGGALVTGATILVTVIPDVTSEKKSTVSLVGGLTPNSVPVGTAANIVITARDQFGNIQITNTDSFVASYLPNDPTSTTTPVIFNTAGAAGLYTTTFTAARSGTFQAYVQLGGNSALQLANSPFSITFVPGRADAVHSKPGGFISGLSTAVAGVGAWFTMDLRDGADNAIVKKNSPEDVICQATAGPLTGGGTVTAADLCFLNPPLNPQNALAGYNRTAPLVCVWTTFANSPIFNCSYTAYKAGSYPWSSADASTGQLKINGRYVPAANLNSGNPLVVLPNIVAASTSGLLQGGLVVPSGTPVSMVIQARDQYMNARTTPNDPDAAGNLLQFWVTISSSPAGGAGAQITAQPQYAGSGQYVFTFIGQTKGQYMLSITLRTITNPNTNPPTFTTEVPCGDSPAAAFVPASQGTPGKPVITVAYGPADVVSTITATPSPSGFPVVPQTDVSSSIVPSSPPIITSNQRAVVSVASSTTGSFTNNFLFTIKSLDAANNLRYDPTTPPIDVNDYVPAITVTDRNGATATLAVVNPSNPTVPTNAIGAATLLPKTDPAATKDANIQGSFYTTRAGTYVIGATLVATGKAIKGVAPTVMVISPGPLAAATAVGAGKAGGPTGSSATFTLTLTDQYGNVRDQFDSITIELSAAVSTQALYNTLPKPGSTGAAAALFQSIRATDPTPSVTTNYVQHRAENYPFVGSYKVNYQITGQAGQLFRIAVLDSGGNVLLTLPCTIVANNLFINAYMSVVQPVLVGQSNPLALLKVFECVQGAPAVAGCTAVNPPQGPFDIALFQTVDNTLNGAHTNDLIATAIVSEPTISNQEPAYYTRFTVNKPGTWWATASRNGISAASTQFVVLPGAVDPNQSTVSISPNPVFAGQAVTITVFLKDTLGNVISNNQLVTLSNNTVTPYGVVAFFQHGATTVTVSSITQNTDFSFTLTTAQSLPGATTPAGPTTLTQAGYGTDPYFVTVSFYNQGSPLSTAQSLAASPYTQNVLPSAPDASLSSFTPSLLTVSFDQQLPTGSTLTVALTDRFGNLVSSSDPTVLSSYSAALSCGEFVSADQTAALKTATANVQVGTCTAFTAGSPGYFVAQFSPKGSGSIFVGAQLTFTANANGDNTGTATGSAAHIGWGGGALNYPKLADGFRSPAAVTVSKGPLSSWNSELHYVSGLPIIITSNTSLVVTAGRDFDFYYYAYDNSAISGGQKSVWKTGSGLLSGYVRIQGVNPDGSNIDKRVSMIITSEPNARYRCTIPAAAVQTANKDGTSINAAILGARYSLHFTSLGLEYSAFAATNDATSAYNNTALGLGVPSGTVTKANVEVSVVGGVVNPPLLPDLVNQGIPFAVTPGKIDWTQTLIRYGLNTNNGTGAPWDNPKIQPIQVSDDIIPSTNPGATYPTPTPTVGKIVVVFRDAAGNEIKLNNGGGAPSAGALLDTTYFTNFLPDGTPAGWTFQSVFVGNQILCAPAGTSIDPDAPRALLDSQRTSPQGGPQWFSDGATGWVSTHTSKSVGSMTLFLFNGGTGSYSSTTQSLLPCALQQQLMQPVTAGTPYYNSSWVVGTTNVTAGETVKYTLTARDQFNNKLTLNSMTGSPLVANLVITVTLGAADITSTTLVPQLDPISNTPVPYINNQDGTYTFYLQPVKTGLVTLQVTLANPPVGNAGKPVMILAAGTPVDGPLGIQQPGSNFVNTPSFIVTPGAPVDFVAYDPTGAPMIPSSVSSYNPRAGITSYIRLIALDRFNNSVITNKHTFNIDLQSATPNIAYGTSALVAADEVGVAGAMRVTYTNTWHNLFRFVITLNYTRYDLRAPQPALCGATGPQYACYGVSGCRATADQCKNPTVYPTHIYYVVFLHADCAFSQYVTWSDPPVNSILGPFTPSSPQAGNMQNPYRCPDNGQCVDSYSKCGPPVPSLPAGQCASGFSGPTSTLSQSCPAPQGGHCVGAPTDSCPAFSAIDFCPAGSIICPNAVGCRTAAEGCPSDVVCPPTHTLCPDRVTCQRSLSLCKDANTLAASSPAVAATPTPSGSGWNSGLASSACPASNPIRCRDGRCVFQAQDCPTGVTCQDPAAKALCPDGSCRASAAACPEIYECRRDAVTNSTLFRCSDGSCRSSLADCPTGVTCPLGQLLCENGRCASTLAQCSAHEVVPLDVIRCADGTQVQNIEHCPSRPSCPPSAPVLCANGACVKLVDLCVPNTPCPAGFQTCADGSCVIKASTGPTVCPKNTACPRATPVLCQDGSCQTSVSACAVLPPCPVSLPTRCPDGSCRGNPQDCPSRTVCPNPAFPVLCPDEQCRESADLCSAVSCPAGTNRCPGGECATALALCPTHVTCPPGTSRCADGSCRINCGNSNSTTASFTCPTGQIACPHVSAGIVCAQSLASCPVDAVCPPDTPVRCLDATCAATVGDCPPAPADTSYSTATPCSDGSWSPNGVGGCPTPVSCPSNAPYKCIDSTCRVAPADCPLVTKCPLGQYRCPNGQCAPTLADPICNSGASQCPPNAPVKCSNGDCKTSVTACPSTTLSGSPVDQPENGDFTVNTGTGCPSSGNTIRCRDGSCVSLAKACIPASTPSWCPAPFTFCAGSGLCSANGNCGDPITGCPHLSDSRCPKSGKCVSNPNKCNAPDADANIPPCPGNVPSCPDGSCPPGGNTQLCPGVNGCGKNQQRCADGTCVDAASQGCTRPDLSSTGANGNVCPSWRPFRCEDGLCVVSSTACPAPLQSVSCTGETPFTCADGSCVGASIQCPIVGPCGANQLRCQDGTCRTPIGGFDMCPRGNTCPFVGSSSATAVQYVRCKTGRCVHPALSSQCPEYGTPGDLSGCLQGEVKCGNGACLSDSATPASFPANTPVQPSSPAVQPTLPPTPAPTPTPNGNSTATPTTPRPTTPAPATGAPTPTPTPTAPPVTNTSAICAPLTGKFQNADGCAPGLQKCFSGECLANLANCAKTTIPNTACVAPTPIKCADGSCVATADTCLAANKCPVKYPVRCASGGCAMYPASFNPPDAALGNTCPISGAACDPGATLCFDGSCQPAASLCPPTRVCPAGTFQCPDGSCGTSCTPACPPGSPVLCPSGACRASPAECGRGASIGSQTGGGGTLGTGGSGSTFILPVPGGGAAASGAVPSTICPAGKYECFDGSCRSGPLECQYWAATVRGTPSGTYDTGKLGTTTPTSTLCPNGMWPCPNGQCVSDLLMCAVIPACPLTWTRCADGTCSNTTCAAQYEACAPVGGTPMYRCQDGSCRVSCTKLQYDGCPYTTPYHCPNRECAANAAACPAPGTHGAPFVYNQNTALQYGVGRRLLQAATGTGTNPFPLSPCYTNCRASVKATSAVFTIVSTKSYDFPIAIDNNGIAQASLSISTGAFEKSSITSLQIVPVGDSRMRDAENFVEATRRAEFGQYMTMVETVLSPAMECRVGNNTKISANAPVLYKASIDMTYFPTLEAAQLQDICLGQLFEIPVIAFKAWRCLLNGQQRSDNPTAVRPNAADPIHLLTGALPDVGCLPSSYTPSGQPVYPVYAFIHQPVRNANIDNGPSWVKRNMLALLLILVGIVVFLAFLVYAINRLHRYRGKYHEERAAVQKQQEEVDEMEQFGGHAGVKDDEVEMMSNPMVIQMKDMQAQLDAKNQEMRLAEQQARAQQSAVRQEHIMNLQNDRDALAMELERLRQELASQNQAAAHGGARRAPMNHPPPQQTHHAMMPSHPQMIPQETHQTNDFQAARPKRRKDF